VNFGVGPLRGIDDLRRALVQHRMVVSLHPDSNYFVCVPSHSKLPPNNRPLGRKFSKKTHSSCSPVYWGSLRV
jgi:hypothetical protein